MPCDQKLSGQLIVLIKVVNPQQESREVGESGRSSSQPDEASERRMVSEQEGCRGETMGGLYHNTRSSSVSLALCVQNPEEGEDTDLS